MNIDWSKAPEGATHKDPDTDCFYKLVKDVWHLICGDGESVVSASLYNGETKPSDLIERPKKQETWDGVGLPPVGMDIECTFDSWGYWRKGRVLYYGKQMIFMEQDGESTDGRKFEGSMNPGGIKFRPIRTAEQVAAEERKSQILDMIDSFGTDTAIWGRDAVMEICGHLWEYGYRKQ